MNNLMRLNQAMEYIENNLTTEIDMKQVSRIALCSEFHFSKMFSYLAGVQLSEYIRNRRMSLAVIDLKHSESSIQDIAVKYGYNSADAFSRAFKSVHGILPSKARGADVNFKAFPRLNFEININGGNEMEYRIVEKEAFNIVGLKKRVTINHNGVNPEIAQMYQQLDLDTVVKLKTMSDLEPRGMISASANFVDRHLDGIGQLDHIIGVATSATSEEFTVTEVEACTWAVFTSLGPFPETLQQTWAKIYGQWFPSNRYAPTGGPELTWHQSPDTTNPEYLSEIWIPVKLTTDGE